jgi:Mg2+-importing ATPase
MYAGQRTFHAAWFVDSLATQTVALFVIPTNGNPFRSRRSRSLTTAALLIVVLGLVLPCMPLGAALGFTLVSLRLVK